MLSMPFAFAPAGVLGSGSAFARPYACAVFRPSLLGALAEAEGTRVPSAGTERRGAAPVVMGFAARPVTQQHDLSTPNDGTTPLGNHSPGRPTS